MGVKVALEHRTTYTFDRVVEIHPHVVRLRPAPHTRTAIEAYSMRVSPQGHFVNWQQDAFGNFLARLVFPKRATELTITVGLVADLEVINPFDFFVEEYAEYAGFGYPRELAADLEPYLRPVADSDHAAQWADVRAPDPAVPIRTIDYLVELNRALRADVGYTVRMEPGVQSPDHTLGAAIGSCRDSAWLLVAVLRRLGLAARFVSGYLVQLAADVASLDGPSGPATDFTDLHAWTEVYLPGAGWVGLDPTSGLLASEGHIPLSATPHPTSAAPITGATGFANTTLNFTNTVRRVHEDPRVTLPYTDAQWDAVRAVGAAIPDIGLTMGGEPTFVSIDDQTSPEWTTAADGPHKRERAADLAARLKDRYAPNGLTQHNQGKWYPGEPLPRWQIALLWRSDGEALWSDQALLADPRSSGSATGEQVRALISAVADGLELPASQVIPAYEGQGLEPIAFVLPWPSADWQLPEGLLVLTDGDSPAGLRLPPQEDAPLTAMAGELRDGLIHVFLPPTERAEDFIDLVARVEAAAATVGEPVVLDGYGPPPDARIQTLSVTPDPGVIEVNIQPTASFAEQADLLETLYEQARLARLSTETFDVDGSHSGTGGGNHITLGGTRPELSPLLRRPDLLVSMLTYWQRHPALSYLFSGRFVGATSQAPRVDEGRESALYELEIAFAEITRLSHAGPWMVDRALRHLLTDITGNTHRAEFCIDKLYDPVSPRGRLGLLELRGFEMPPHFQMAMVQALLVRAMVTTFWEKPYRAPLLRHGANLHGRMLLPHYVIADINEVVADLNAAGVEFDVSWLDPFIEFRFPRIGVTVIDGVEIELRTAIEPWQTLGEESTATGTARYVDSSVERLQVRVTGSTPGRHIVTCNGFPIPMLATDKADTQVAGVRYRAWQPPSALHPSISIDSPLVFDLVDAASGVSRGGCVYHVVHPGGRSYEDRPVNAVAAEARRHRRFETATHTPKPHNLATLSRRTALLATDLAPPGILDLRRARTLLQ